MNYRDKEYKGILFNTLQECLYSVCEKHADHVAYRQLQTKNEVEEMSYGVFLRMVTSLSAKMLSMGMQGYHVGLIGETSIHWLMAYMAVVGGIGVSVPLDRELDTETLAYQINFSDCKAVFLSAKIIKRLDELQRLCPDVQHWIIMRPMLAKALPESVLRMDTMIQDGALMADEIEAYRKLHVQPDDLCDIVFTSGTTGANKGVMLTHRNVTSVISGSLTHISVKDKSQSLTCLPVHHAYEKNCHLLCSFALGYTLCINDDMMHLVQNMRMFRPCNSTMVPMLLETIENRIKAELKKRDQLVRVTRVMKTSNFLRTFHIDRRRKMFQPILTLMGENLQQIVVGGAPLKDETRKFFDSLGVSVINGYGISECAPLVAANYTFYQRPGSVGTVIPCCEVKIVDPDENGEGIIYVRGDNVMVGYYKDPEGTKRVLSEDGWFNTGDLGYMDKDGFLYLSGRVKNLIILSNGKNVHPEELEDILCDKIPYIKEIVVYADELGKGIYASAFLDREFLDAHEITDAYQYLMRDLARVNQSMPPYKRVVDVTVFDKEFEKTTTKKIKRHRVEKKYQKA